MHSTRKVFVLTATVVVALLLLYYVPTFSYNGFESRRIDLIGDLKPSGNDTGEMMTGQDESTMTGPEAVSQETTTVSTRVTYRPQGVTLIDDYSEGEPGGMGHFYGKLLEEPVTGPVRIAYFGDSFIENDLLTADLREMLQAKYGGNGPGWVNCGGATCQYRPTITTRFSNLTEYVVMKKPFNKQLQGISQRYYLPKGEASLRLTATKFKTHAGNWNQATLFFKTDTAVTIQANINGKMPVEKRFDKRPEVQTLKMTGEMTSVSYRMSRADRKTQLFGVALDDDQGIILDNFGMRGSPGYLLSGIPLKTLKEIGQQRPYDLIILQFGLNYVSEQTTDAMFRTYISRMKRVIENMRQAFPDASIAVFGVPDRAQRTANGIHTMKGIEKMARYQQELAKDCGVGFLNIQQVMGGHDSMAKYVSNGWAAKDYTHLSFRGGRKVAEGIYQSILAGVENYRRNINTHQQTTTDHD